MKTRVLLLSFALALSSPMTFAEEGSSDLCSDPGIAFAFFNGVQTTPVDAQQAKNEFIRLFGETSPAGETIKYEVLYNYSEGFED
jgi:hypothetical protein